MYSGLVGISGGSGLQVISKIVNEKVHKINDAMFKSQFLPVRHVGQSCHVKYPSGLQYNLKLDFVLSVSQNMVGMESMLFLH